MMRGRQLLRQVNHTFTVLAFHPVSCAINLNDTTHFEPPRAEEFRERVKVDQLVCWFAVEAKSDRDRHRCLNGLLYAGDTLSNAPCQTISRPEEPAAAGRPVLRATSHVRVNSSKNGRSALDRLGARGACQTARRSNGPPGE